MVLRYDTKNHQFATVATGTVLQRLTPQAGGDVDGNDRWLRGIRMQEGADVQRVQVTCPAWGARIIETPPVGQFGSLDGPRTFWLPWIVRVPMNQSPAVFVTQDSGAAQAVSVDLLYLDGDQVPASLKATEAKVHCQFLSGTTTAGSFPSAPTDAEQLSQDANTK